MTIGDVSPRPREAGHALRSGRAAGELRLWARIRRRVCSVGWRPRTTPGGPLARQSPHPRPGSGDARFASASWNFGLRKRRGRRAPAVRMGRVLARGLFWVRASEKNAREVRGESWNSRPGPLAPRTPRPPADGRARTPARQPAAAASAQLSGLGPVSDQTRSPNVPGPVRSRPRPHPGKPFLRTLSAGSASGAPGPASHPRPPHRAGGCAPASGFRVGRARPSRPAHLGARARSLGKCNPAHGQKLLLISG